MKKSFSKLFLAPLTVLVLASFALAPVAEAARGGGGMAVAREPEAAAVAPSRSIIPIATCVPTIPAAQA